MNILIVDDEIRAVQALVRRMPWKEYGFEDPFTAYSMAQAKDVFSTCHVDLMLSDIEMPQGSGLELFEWVKSFYPKTECIFVTCHDEYEYLRAAMQLGSCDYILKPVNYDQLKETLHSASDRINHKEELRKLTDKAVSYKADKLPLPARNQTSNDYINSALDYIARHLTEDMSVPDIAQTVHLNEQYFMRLFKKETGGSVLQYITARRIALSIYYLENTEMSITDIAVSSGFDNYSYFNRIFKRLTGTTPSKYRQK